MMPAAGLNDHPRFRTADALCVDSARRRWHSTGQSLLGRTTLLKIVMVGAGYVGLVSVPASRVSAMT